jgi:hypothetical protein
MSSSAPLKSLVAVRQAAEASAAQALAAALQRRAAAEANQQRLDHELGSARDDLRARRRSEAGRGGPSPPATGGVETAARASERERFWARMADEIGQRSRRADAHRAGPLAEARGGADSAAATHRQAREAREVVQRLYEKSQHADRALAARRDEVASDDLATARHGRPTSRPR